MGSQRHRRFLTSSVNILNTCLLFNLTKTKHYCSLWLPPPSSNIRAATIAIPPNSPLLPPPFFTNILKRGEKKSNTPSPHTVLYSFNYNRPLFLPFHLFTTATRLLPPAYSMGWPRTLSRQSHLREQITTVPKMSDLW